VRGGPGSTASLPIIDDPKAVPSEYIQEGMPTDCTRWIVANNTQAACWKLANDAKITMPKLFELNPILGVNGQDCGNKVWLGYYYCIARSGDGNTPTPTKSGSTQSVTGAPKPSQTQAGIATNCNKFEKAVSGDGCQAVASRGGAALGDFYKWNTALGSNGASCSTAIWPDYYYCVGVATAATSGQPTATSSAPKPTKTQSGFATNCKTWVEAKGGDSCWALGNNNGVALEQLYRLNPVLGDNGANCGSQLWPEYFYCLST
jgi:LysM repeat protein